MSDISVETNNLGWQIAQWQQRLSERWELMGRKLGENLADIPFPSWLDSPLIRVVSHLVFWGVIAGLLIWITWKGQQWVKWYRRKLKSRNHQTTFPNVSERIQASSADYWIIQARKAQQQGNYQQACQFLYQGMLQQLHERKIVPHQSSRTDGEYGKLIAKMPQPQPYQQLLQIHQELCFGDFSASMSVLETCWQAYNKIEKS
ncbi:DUF4129 domain-containing protein [Crocosphaera sp.]|uniref:DUF4129 domain-containing protein n=1 Tax=Crocosphaera sp. TaxID=2729996 RepID=UPI003F240146|nr:DUF4129 domain-containing protein [Crocosphaera sp.]